MRVIQNLTKTAKELRKNATDAEQLLWHHLRARQLNGLKFRRQQPVGNFIVDFICFEKKLITELDGGQHAFAQEKDQQRDEWLKEEGFHVLRFWNNDVLGNIEGIYEEIMKYCSNTLPLTPSLSAGGGSASGGREGVPLKRRLDTNPLPKGEGVGEGYDIGSKLS